MLRGFSLDGVAKLDDTMLDVERLPPVVKAVSGFQD
jgi:hypothetical protein